MLRTLEQMGEWERKGRWGGENQAYREMPSCSVKAEVKIVAVKMEATVVWKLLPPSYRSRCAETAAAPGPGMAEEQRGRRRGGVVRRTARRRGGADCEAAWSRSTSCGRRMTRSRGAEGRGGGAVRTREVGCDRPGEKPRIGFTEPVEVGFQTATNLAMGRNCRGVPSRGKLEDLGFPNEP
jgi:hypothetical protein